MVNPARENKLLMWTGLSSWPALLACLALLAGCVPEEEPLPPLEGPQPRMTPLPAESPVMQFRVEAGGRIYGQNAQGWLMCWDQDSGRLVWEVPAPALARLPGVLGNDLVTQAWSGQFEVRDRHSGLLRWSRHLDDLPMLRWDRYGDFFRLWDGAGRLVLLDSQDGRVLLDRAGAQNFRWPRVERWREDHPWILDAREGAAAFEAPAEYPPVPEDLVDWLKDRGRSPEDLLYYPAEQDLVGIRGAKEENPVLFTAWKAGVYTFSSPSQSQIPLKISLKDFAGAEMDSNMGYGEIRQEVSWKLKKGEPMLLDLVLINPEFTGQDIMVQVGVR